MKKFGRKLFYEEAETDLTIFLLEFINKVNLEKFKSRKDELATTQGAWALLSIALIFYILKI
ncbi:BhlA/UviB family holin-like peptide [Sedimentibacter sp. MB31-C6]|uniref:BhlA/UviB family holin-like peptide n=1 Tax=Sedimentibacter sp. MB31-C6 TaxID=3109366 RepID=UPI002DDD62AE|nr:BhlA/UviB family holin-like peptide [Sedimentibacter sp. MB36-C1]WSI05595.1 BhlA/UviB family holin-like peptide [Sedimentibacter sp. MB36-C1]